MTLPPILSSRVADDETVHELALSEDLAVFRGHFPGRPVLPGVAQIDWAAQLAARAWGVPAVAREFRVKFKSVIVPGVPLTLALRYDRTKCHVHFEYRSADRVMSMGRIVVEPVAAEPEA